MKKFLCIFISLVIIFSNIVYAEDILEDGLRAVLLGECESGEILYSYNIDNPIEIASITKLMTYLIVMDAVESGKVTLDDVVIVSRNACKEYGSIFNLKPGEKIKLSTLIDSILIVSGNDSCVAIAEYIAGSEEKFVDMMNDKAKEIGLESAVFLNSNGLPEKNGQNKMSVRDIFKLSRYVINRYPEILDITKKKELIIENRNFKKENTNPIVGISNVDGLKTGYTDLAGYCLVSTWTVPKSRYNDRPFRLIGITMGAKSEEERKNKSLQLVDYGMDNYINKKVVSKNEIIKTVKVKDAVKQDVDIVCSEDLYMFIRKGSDIKRKIVVNKNLNPPMKKGEVIGKIEFYVDGQKREEANLVLSRDVYKINIFMKILRYIMTLIGITK